MALADLFEDHLKLAVRLGAGRPLRAVKGATPPTVALFTKELSDLEKPDTEFDRTRRKYDEADFQRAKYAVDALIDRIAKDKFGDWTRRCSDTDVGHKFYEQIRTIHHGNSTCKFELLELYVLCALLGFREDKHADDYESVNQAFREVIDASAQTHFPIKWQPSPILWRGDPQLEHSHHTFKYLLLTMLVAYPVLLLFLYQIAWIGFDRS